MHMMVWSFRGRICAWLNFSRSLFQFLLSIGPQTTKQPGYYFIDHDDEAVRGMLVVENGKLMYPAPLPPPAAVVEKKEEEIVVVEPDYKKPYFDGAKNAAYLSTSILAVGAVAPNGEWETMGQVFVTFVHLPSTLWGS